jgi:hypothetical protein
LEGNEKQDNTKGKNEKKKTEKNEQQAHKVTMKEWIQKGESKNEG